MHRLEALLLALLKNALEYFLSYIIIAFILCYLKFDNKVVNGELRILPSRETVRMTSILAFWGFFVLLVLAAFIIG
jgi:hypothetical protein